MALDSQQHFSYQHCDEKTGFKFRVMFDKYFFA